ncbi:MAG: hypothetical protein IPN92_19775 [Chromatiaceae bacterium]|nr:hypothetical protein [Chromatiaceae bacterium]
MTTLKQRVSPTTSRIDGTELAEIRRLIGIAVGLEYVMADWKLAIDGQQLFRIDPLR